MYIQSFDDLVELFTSIGEPYQEWLIRVPDSIIERFLDDKLSYGVICYRILALNRDCPEIIGHDARISMLSPM
jgi:hypothetical protein